MRRDPVGFVAAIEALAKKPATHKVRVVDDGRILFRGTEAQCRWVVEGYDKDLREGHPDAVGDTQIVAIGGIV